jgi:hypothetical protein
MRRIAWLVLLLVPGFVSAAPLQVLGVYDTNENTMKAIAPRYAQELTALGPSLNLQFTWVPDDNPSSIPLIGYGRGIGSYFGKTTNFDALVVIGYDAVFAPAGTARFDSLCTVAKYPTIPTLFLATRYGFNPAQTPADSIGFGGYQYDYPINGQVSVLGTNVRLQVKNYAIQAGPFLNFADGSTSLVIGGITATGANNDTALVVHRSVGAGITYCPGVLSAGEANSNRAMSVRLLAVLRWLKDLSSANRPNLRIPVALHIDDGWRYNGFFKPQHEASASAWMDSLKARNVKWTIGVTTDSIPNYYNRAMAIWDRGSDYTKFTPHTHSRDGNTNGTGGYSPAHANTYQSPTDIWGIIGVRPNCDADPVGTAADTGSVYAALKTATDTLASYVGQSRIDHAVMPPADDYTPQLMNANGQCTIDRLLNAIRHAGYPVVRFNSTTDPFSAQSGNVGSSYGYYNWPGFYRTLYGDIRLVGCPGYFPQATDSVISQQNPEVTATTLIRASMMGGFTDANGTPRANGTGTILVQHNVNYKLNDATGGVGWYQVREICNLMDACNYIYGQPVFRWVWSEELGAR